MWSNVLYPVSYAYRCWESSWDLPKEIIGFAPFPSSLSHPHCRPECKRHHVGFQGGGPCPWDGEAVSEKEPKFLRTSWSRTVLSALECSPPDSHVRERWTLPVWKPFKYNLNRYKWSLEVWKPRKPLGGVERTLKADPEGPGVRFLALHSGRVG